MPTALPRTETRQKPLLRRTRPSSAFALAHLLDGHPPDSIPAATHALMRQLAPRQANRKANSPDCCALAQSWLANAAGAEPSVAYALECLAWAYDLSAWHDPAAVTIRMSLAEHLARIAHQADELDLQQQPVLQQILAGELPMVLSQSADSLALRKKLQSTGANAWAKNAATLLNGEGLPQARHLQHWASLLASWLRCRDLARQIQILPTASEDPTQFLATLEQALRFSRGDGSQVLEPLQRDKKTANHRPALWQAIQQSGHVPIQRLARVVQSKPAPLTGRSLPPASYECEWSQLAVMRADWSAQGNLLAIAYDGRDVRLELQAQGRVLFAGIWSLNLQCDGTPLPAPQAWHNVCWFSDKEVDYLELEARPGGQVCLQRQILLNKAEGFVYLADAIVAHQPHHWNYSGQLPIGPLVSSRLGGETREALLGLGRRRYSVLPLALPEWRRDPRGGQLALEDTKLSLIQSFHGQALYAPLFIDLNSARVRQGFTWRQLTVAEERRNLRIDQASGYRVQAGKQQWIVYRSLGPVGNRTLLGHNLVSEFLVARFTKAGTVESLVEIE